MDTVHIATEKYNDRTLTIKYIVMHATGGTDSRGWLSQWDKKNPKSEQNNVSIHYLIDRHGTIYSIVPEDKRAWHVGNCRMPDGETDGNSCSIGIELENLNQPYTDLQLVSAAKLVADLVDRYSINGKHVVSHASVATPAGRKVDPLKFDWANFWNLILATPQNDFTADTHILGTASGDVDKIAVFIYNKSSKQYTLDDVKLIVGYYKKYGDANGINWTMALAQCMHETGWLSSWWSARPRRNPAGIGVNGQRTSEEPADTSMWVQVGSQWIRGQSFESWDIAVQHHLSRLLCYALKDNLTDAQKQLSTVCKGLPDKYRGIAPTWIGLNGRWAVPGTTYAQTVARIANTLRL